MEATKTLLQDISSLERQLQDIITQRELMGINHTELEKQQEALHAQLMEKKKTLRGLTQPDSAADRKQRALITNGVSLQLMEGIAGMEERLCASLPLTGVLPLDNVALATLEGPTNTGDVHSVSNYMCASALSTYPRMPGTQSRQGDPICDRYTAQLHSNGAIVALADGCNWGRLPYEAAVRASEAFTSFLAQHIGHITSIRGAGPFLLAAMTRAHYSIIEGRETWDSGTTTLIGGLLLPLAGAANERKWGFVCVSLGDCKAFHYSRTSKSFIDITKGNRRNLTDARDPGGRLGPYIGVGPDLRNLRLYYQPVDMNDLIFLVSDGVHDNLDPQQLGTTPSEADIANTPTWEEAEKISPNAVEAFKDEFRMKWFQEAFHKSGEENAEVVPQQVVEVLFRHAMEVTRTSRAFMERHPQKRLPQDYKIYPGKMDHVSCLCVRANEIPSDSPPDSLSVTVTAHLSIDSAVDGTADGKADPDHNNDNSQNTDAGQYDEQAAAIDLESTLPS